MTVYDNFYVYFPADDVIKESFKKIEPFKSKFGMDTNKLFEDMFASYREPGFTSRFSKNVSISAIVDESTFLNTKSSSFLSNHKEVILFSLLVVSVIGLFDYYAKNNFVYEFQWFVDEKKNITEKITKPNKVSKNIQQLNNREFLIYALNKLKNGQRLSEEELSYLLLLLKNGILTLLKILRNGLISIYLIALFIKILMVLTDYFRLLNLKDPIFSPAISKILTKELMLPVENDDKEKRNKFENDLTFEIIKEAETKKMHSLEEELNNELMEKIIEKCKNQPRSRYGAMLEKRALKIPLTKFNRLGERITPIRNDFWCTLGSKNIKETIELEKKRIMALQELKGKQITKSE